VPPAPAHRGGHGWLTVGGRRPPGSCCRGQVLGLAPAQGGYVELTFPEPGSYPFVTHAMADAERGLHGILRVTP